MAVVGAVRGAARFALVLTFLAASGGAAGGGDGGVVTRAAADHGVRAVLIDLGLSDSPTPADFEIAGLMLEVMSELAPDDADLARLEASAAFGTGDPGLLAKATARVVALDPSDTVAQLRLITARIAARQTAEERLEVYERMLGPRGASIDPTVRSRLALDAALIERERGELDRFLRYLTLATDLDRTNKEAHHLATSYFAEYAGGDPESLAGLLELQLNLMWADPIDPNVHFGISRLLAIEGAMRESARFHENGLSILSIAGMLEPRHRVQALALQWLLEGPRVVLDTIDRELKVARDNARIRFELDRQRDVPERLLRPPEKVFLDPLYEKIRIIAAMDAQDGAALMTGIRELDAYARFQFNEVQEATRLDEPQARERAFRQFADTLVSLQFMRALANADLRSLVAQVPELPRIIGQEEWDQIRRPLEAWIALRAGDFETTRNMLGEIGIGSSIMRVCAAELLAAEGKAEEAAMLYESILRTDPFVPYGAWARSRAMELTGRTDPVTPAGRRMQRLVAEVPVALDRTIRDPSSMIALHIDPVKPSFGAGERAVVKVALTNLSPWPLSLGPSRTVSSRLLLGVAVDDAPSLPSGLQPMVVDMDRRFRLERGATLVVETEIERGLNGMIIDASDRGILRMRCQGWQSPTIDGSGAYIAGPFGLSDSTPKFTRSMHPEMRLTAGELAERIRAATEPASFVAAVESGASRLRTGDPGSREIAAALGERYLASGEGERALMLAAVPNASQAPAASVFEEAVAYTMNDQAVRGEVTARVTAALAMLTRARTADDPLLESGRRSGDANLSRLASLIARRLMEKRPSYATTGEGIDRFSGMTRGAAIRGSAP